MALELLTGPELLGFVGIDVPTPEESARAVEVSSAIEVAITNRLDWPAERIATADELLELREAAKLAGAELWARRTATFGVTGYADATGAAIRVSRDPLESVRPMVDRHRAGAGGSFG